MGRPAVTAGGGGTDSCRSSVGLLGQLQQPVRQLDGLARGHREIEDPIALVPGPRDVDGDVAVLPIECCPALKMSMTASLSVRTTSR